MKHYKNKFFKTQFWLVESKINIFLIRNGFVKNLLQSDFILKKNIVYLNGKLTTLNYKLVKLNDLIQIKFYYFFLFKLFFKKKFNKFFFFINNSFFKKKYPFYIEKNYSIYSCILLYKPLPSFFAFYKQNFFNFNFFFYRYFFYYIKKKRF